MGLSAFTRLTTAIRVRDIMLPAYGAVDHDINLEVADDHLGDCGDLRLRNNVPCLVKDSSGRVVGWVSPSQVRDALMEEVKSHDWTEKQDGTYASGDEPRLRVRDIMLPIEPSRVVSGDFTLFGLVTVFASLNYDWLWVIDAADICGTIHSWCLQQPEFTASLLCLILEVESAVAELISLNQLIAWEGWDCLKPQRQAKALTYYHQMCMREGLRPEELMAPEVFDIRLLDWITMADKATILKKRALLPKRKPREVQEFFRRAENVRNACAHGRLHPLGRDDVVSFVLDCHRFIQEIVSVTQAKKDALGWPNDEPYDPLDA